MMSNRVTIQNIADALQLSRNTVSKALNDPESVPAATRRRVVDMATSMNYKSLQTIVSSKRNRPLQIVLVSLENKLSSSFFTMLYQKLYEQSKQYNMELTIQLISNADIRTKRFPESIQEADGILNMEVLNADYIQALLKLGKPVVFFDFTDDSKNANEKFDIVMEQSTATYQLTERLIRQGRTRIGFFGCIDHCIGFKERFYSFRNAMLDHNLPLDSSTWIIHDKQEMLSSPEYVLSRLRRLNLPQAFVCANDYMAFVLMDALEKMEIAVPDDIAVCGFDNVPDFLLHRPYLTTINCSRDMLASSMLTLLAGRIQDPSLEVRVLYVGGEIVLRQSLS